MAGRHLWLMNNVAVIISELIDTKCCFGSFVFYRRFLLFKYIFLSFSLWFNIAKYEFFVKCISMLLGTPILYFVLWGIKKILIDNK